MVASQPTPMPMRAAGAGSAPWNLSFVVHACEIRAGLCLVLARVVMVVDPTARRPPPGQSGKEEEGSGGGGSWC